MFQIQQIASIFTGHTLRIKAENDPKGDCYIIQARDVDSDTNTIHQPVLISSIDIPPRQFLQKGDVLLLSKGGTNKAIAYQGQFQKVAAVSSFTIIRLGSHHIMPAYLACYLNSSAGQEYFNSFRAGTSTLNLPLQAIGQMLVPVPPAEVQHNICSFYSQFKKHQALTAEYHKNYSLLIESIMYNQLKNQ